MMRRVSLLALFRGSEGRSLARGLAFLVLVTVLLAGLHGGAMADGAATGTEVVCTSAGGHGNPASPAGNDDYRSCCLIGCLSVVTSFVAPSSPVLADAPPAIATPALVARSVACASPHLLDRPTGPRGPPLRG